MTTIHQLDAAQNTSSSRMNGPFRVSGYRPKYYAVPAQTVIHQAQHNTSVDPPISEKTSRHLILQGLSEGERGILSLSLAGSVEPTAIYIVLPETKDIQFERLLR